MVGSPARSMLSLMANGMPYSGNESGSMPSRCRARARSASSDTSLIQMWCASKACRAASSDSTSCEGVRSRAAYRRASEVMLRSSVMRSPGAAPATSRRRARRIRPRPWIATTVPEVSATTAISIFIASMITSASPFSTRCPASTRICQTLPDTGDVTATQSSGNSGAAILAGASMTGASETPAARQRSRSAPKAARCRSRNASMDARSRSRNAR